MKTLSLLISDIVDSTSFSERVGHSIASATWQSHDRLSRAAMHRHGGLEIDRSDGFFLVFETVPDAAAFALEYHQLIEGLGLAARVGIHSGAVTLRRASEQETANGAKPIEVDGVAKPLAARIMALARGGQTLLSRDARDALPAERESTFEIVGHGHYRLKGIDDPCEIFELLASPTAAALPPADIEKAYRVVRVDDLWLPVREIRNNLPAERDAFVGRYADLRSLSNLLSSGHRLVTVVGPGGMGKTRLARRYGYAWLGDWPGGVYFCDLSDCSSLDGVYFAVAGALGVQFGRGDPGTQLGHAISARKRCVVVLDNFEQVITHAAGTIGAWMDQAKEASFVVTSRERLHVSGEKVLLLDALPADAAMELFKVRASARVTDFQFDTQEEAIAEIVRMLDCVPLAIELASARISILSPTQMVQRLRDRFQVLGKVGGAGGRHSTLQTTIDWSWNLLADWEQSGLAQCSVFEGSFSLEAAEAVLDLSSWADAPQVLDVVQALLEKSLIRRWSAPTGKSEFEEVPHFAMYLSIHEYSRAKLAALGHEVEGAAQRRHGEYFASFGTDEAIDTLDKREYRARRRLLIHGLDNLVSACRRAIARGDFLTATRTYRAAWEILAFQGPFVFGFELGGEVLAMPRLPDAPRDEVCMTRALAAMSCGLVDDADGLLRRAQLGAQARGASQREAQVLVSLAKLRGELGSMDEAEALLVSAMTLTEAHTDRTLRGRIAGALANLYSQRGRTEKARSLYEEALSIARETGHRLDEAASIANLGMLLQHVGRIDEARAFYLSALSITGELGSRRVEAIMLSNLGICDQDQGLMASAKNRYEQAIAIHRDLGYRREEAIALGNLADLNQSEGRVAEARAQYLAALDIDRGLSNRRHEAYVLESLGTLSLKERDFATAKQHFESALAINRAVDNPRAEACVLAGLAEVFCSQDSLIEARAHVAESELLLRKCGLVQDLAKVLCVRGTVDVAEADMGAARDALAEAEGVALTIGVGPSSELAKRIQMLRQMIE